MSRVLIVGAGISGLTVAYRLQQALPQAEITVVEPRDRPGGAMWTESRQGFQIEIGPNGFLDAKPTTVELCRDLGLDNSLVPASDAAANTRFLLVNGKLTPLPGSLWAFLTTGLLSCRGKASLLLERFRPAGKNISDESIYTFAARRAGREVAEVFADALTTGIHGGDPRLLSMLAAFPRLAALEREHGSVIKGLRAQAYQKAKEAKSRGLPPPGRSKMWSLANGLGVLAEALAGGLKSPPKFGVRADRVVCDRTTGKVQWIVSASPQATWTTDALVLACPAYEQASLLLALDQELSEKIGSIPYNRLAVVALGYRAEDAPRLDGFGYIALQSSRRDLLGVQWCSTIYPGRAPRGTVLLRALCGGWHRADIADWDDERLLASVRAELAVTMGIRSIPIMHHIVRWPHAIPQYLLGHLDRVTWIEARTKRHPGLFLTGNAYRGVALNDCTENAAEVARQVARCLSPSPRKESQTAS